ncbi:MAG: hypothetical protein QOJ91_2609 [Sphingomonadales bacterium]|jgi:hypothetical protein|nr:hypothetical protein [Sphingomonadales bacterium]
MSEQHPLIVFPDTNVLVQGRALRELPWAALGHDPVEVMLCGPVIRELDRLKNKGGRAGKVARSISTKVRELMRSPDKCEVLSESGPRVTLRLAPGMPNQGAARAGIDLTHDDQAIINQALTFLDAGEHVILLTDDNFAAMMAEHFGLPVRLLPEHWLKEPEPDDSSREIARRDAEIRRLKAAEPVPQLRFVDSSSAPIDRLETMMERYLPVPPADVDHLVERVETLAPMVKVEPISAGKIIPPRTSGEGFDISSIAYSSLGMTPVTQADIGEYEVEYHQWLRGIRSTIARVHEEWNRLRKWPQATLLAANGGSRPADDVLVEIEAFGEFELSDARPEDGDDGPPIRRHRLELALPPTPPRPRSRAEELMATAILHQDPFRMVPQPHFPTLPPQREDDAFYWRSGESKATKTMSLECKCWRHGRDEEDFSFRVRANDHEDVSGLIVGRVSAANLAKPTEKHLPLRITFEDRECLTMATRLVDEFEHRLAARRS